VSLYRRSLAQEGIEGLSMFLQHPKRLRLLAILLAMSCFFGGAHPLQANSIGADAVVLVNSSSSRFSDFQHYLQPYLDHFGVPYTVLDISTNPVPADVGRFAVIIVGHSLLDTNLSCLTTNAQSYLSTAVSNGTGLVNFDNVLSISNTTPRYQFVQEIFGFGYIAATNGANVSFPATGPASQMHYITALHQAGETNAFRASIPLTGITLPLDVSAVALSSGRPLLSITKRGQGHAVQWSSYDWMAVSAKGPMAGLDDLVWRSIVWAARKPFVMRGLPNFITMRIDDGDGNFDWAHAAVDTGFKPYITVFFDCIATPSLLDLRTLSASSNVTISVHSFGCSGIQWLYWNHINGANWPDNVVSNYLAMGKQWHVTNQIPISKVVVPHYSEIGPNAIAGLQSWGVEYLTPKNDPGTARDAPWLVAGPYRLYEPRQPGSILYPLFYADFLTVPGHPELNGKFFACVTEIRDDAACGEWCPDNDVAGTIGRGTRQLKRAMDSCALGTLYSHEWYIHPNLARSDMPAITTSNWRAILQGITNNMAAYNPIHVTLDYACQYLRATRTSRLVSTEFDTNSGRLTAKFSGKTDLDISVQVFVGEDGSISNSLSTVPAFSGPTTITAATFAPPTLSVALAPTNQVLLCWPSAFATFQIQSATNLTEPVIWTTLTNTPQVVSNLSTMTLPIASTRQFFRLAGSVAFTTPPGPPIELKSAGTNLVVSWPVFFAGFSVQTATNLTPPFAWGTLTNAPLVISNRNTVTLPAASGTKFFRLIK
jgi:hypothetical protein